MSGILRRRSLEARSELARYLDRCSMGILERAATAGFTTIAALRAATDAELLRDGILDGDDVDVLRRELARKDASA